VLAQDAPVAVIGMTLETERPHDRRVGYCYRDGQDIAAGLICAGLARDCPRFSSERYAAVERASERELPLPQPCQPRPTWDSIRPR
jgi:endonuclease YncB( thermonuclease family)